MAFWVFVLIHFALLHCYSAKNVKNCTIAVQKQLANHAQAFVVKDGIEQPYLNVIPLWHFGFLY